MFKLSFGFIAGFFLGQVLTIEFVLIACFVFILLIALVFIVFHLGLRDFQEY